ncbi:hypothetical protein [Flavobacterium poyangense]|uniref:hypothetical protein n=1 Tax=Flavobacterium poyangense TaxID=2204302 RepID=UPI001422C0C7|nr:hypothetical protein [Flavobacterium sp. JXAS1]
MKIHFIFTLQLILFICYSEAQEKEKDTLFFGIDKYYTISPTITPNTYNKTYLEKVEAEREQIKHTTTNGYITFIGNGYLITDLKTKKILSIKNYIENRKFYYEGVYNQIVDNTKLKDSLTDKYEIFFVNGNEFIKPRHLEYTSYYPTRDKDWNVIDNRIKDTLFFKLDNEYIREPEGDQKWYFLKDSNKSDPFLFIEEKIIHGLKPKKILLLEEYIKSSKFYDKIKTTSLKDHYFATFLSNYVVILVRENKQKTEFIEVYAGTISFD